MSNKECTKCIHKEVCKTAESCDGYVSGCKHFVVISNLETTTQTNADRIRAMSDEELARFLAENEWECETYNDCAKCPRMTDDGCVSLSKWLKQPADMRGEEDGK